MTADGNQGIVYILSNPAMGSYVKIGCTGGDSSKAVITRMKSLDTTEVPLSFRCEYAAVVENYEQVEKGLHTAFGDNRVREKREFFDIAPHRVAAVLKLLEVQNVTPGVGEAEATADPGGAVLRAPRRPAFRFDMVNMPIGAILRWVDDPEITCEVVSDSKIRYEGETYSLSGLAQKLKGGGALQGPAYWLYEEETLQERRNRYESDSMAD